MPSFFSLAPARRPWIIDAHQECRDATTPANLRVGDGVHNVESTFAAVGNPTLGTVQDPCVAITPRNSAHVRRVRAGGRLTQAVRPDVLATGEPRQVLPLLLLGAETHDRIADQRVVDRHDHGVRGAAP